MSQPTIDSKKTIEENDDLAVVVIAPTGRDAELSCEILRRANIASLACQSFSDLMRRLDSDSGPVVMAVEAVNEEAAERLQAKLELQPQWSDLPLVIFKGERGLPRYLEDLARRSNATLLQRPIQVVSFVSSIRAAVRSRMRQYETRDLLKQLSSRARQLRRLALELTEAEERERNRLAQILHDDLQQLLVAIKFQLEVFPGRIRKDGISKPVEEIVELVEMAIGKSRSLSHDLSPPILKKRDMATSLKWLADRMNQLYGLRVTVDARIDAEPAQMQLRAFLFRSAQEYLFNVVKHAGTDTARVKLSSSAEGVELCVSDSGVGFLPEHFGKNEKTSGFGLFSIRERAHLLGGRFQVESAPGKGSMFTLTMPLNWTGPDTAEV